MATLITGPSGKPMALNSLPFNLSLDMEKFGQKTNQIALFGSNNFDDKKKD